MSSVVKDIGIQVEANDNTKEVYQTVQIVPDAPPTLVTSFDQDLSPASILLHPNPANQKAMIYFAEKLKNNVTLVIYDQFGKIVLEHTVLASLDEVEIDTKGMVPGFYHV